MFSSEQTLKQPAPRWSDDAPVFVDDHHGQGDFLSRDNRHERIGARWLARVFDVSVTAPIDLHVQAKRYLCSAGLCSADPAYYAKLSESSRRSLAVQGGPMSAKEMMDYLALNGAADALQVRRIDDLA